MRERVISDFIALRVLLFHDAGILSGDVANHKKGGGRLFFLQYLQNFRSPIGIGTVVEGERYFVRGSAHFFDAPGKRVALVRLVIEHITRGIVVKCPPSALWRRGDAPNVAVTF